MLGFLNKRPVLVTKVHFRTKVSIFGIPIPINRRKYSILALVTILRVRTPVSYFGKECQLHTGSLLQAMSTRHL